MITLAILVTNIAPSLAVSHEISTGLALVTIDLLLCSVKWPTQSFANSGQAMVKFVKLRKLMR